MATSHRLKKRSLHSAPAGASVEMTGGHNPSTILLMMPFWISLLPP